MLTPLRTLPARLLAALAFAGLGPLAHAQDETPVLVPLNAFFDSQSIRQMVLSPDGNKVAMIAPNKGRYSLAALDTTNGQVSVVVHFKDENIRSVFWKGNDRLLFTSAVEGHEIPLLASTDLAGKSEAPQPSVQDRKFLEIDVDNFDARMKSMKPRVAFSVPNTLTGEGNLSVDVSFESMDDFSPAAVARRVGGLDKLLEARTQLSNLITYMDGKTGAEELISKVLADPALLASLTAESKPQE